MAPVCVLQTPLPGFSFAAFRTSHLGDKSTRDTPNVALGDHHEDVLRDLMPGRYRTPNTINQPFAMNDMIPNYSLDSEALGRLAHQNHEAYDSASPFPHAVLDDVFPPEWLHAVLKEFR